MPLKANQVAAAIAAGVDRKIADGNNLYLVVKNGRGFWVVQYREGQKIRSKGLGSAANLSPAQARRAREDFVVRRRSENKSAGEEAHCKGPASAPLLFGDAVEEFIIHRARVKNWKGGVPGAEADSYRRTLMRTSIAKVPLASIETANVLAVLQGHTHVNEVVAYKNTQYITSGAVCGNWWHGARLGTPEGFTVVSLREGKITTRYETYGFRSVAPIGS